MFMFTAPSVVIFALFTVMLGAFQAGGQTKDIMAMNITRAMGSSCSPCISHSCPFFSWLPWNIYGYVGK